MSDNHQTNYDNIVMDILKAFGQQIREFRKNTGMRQDDFATSISMDRTYYGSVENGKRNISLENIKKIADGFDVPISELFKGL